MRVRRRWWWASGRSSRSFGPRPWRRPWRARRSGHATHRLALLVIAALLAGCHERQVTRRVVRPHEPVRLTPPDSARYGRLELYEVREVRRPTALGRFPDGGTTIDVAVYYEAHQHGPGQAPRVIGRLPMRLVRRGDFGDVIHGEASWPAPDRLRWWVRHGYSIGLVRTDTAELTIPPLDAPVIDAAAPPR
jgi:hypothetical protein